MSCVQLELLKLTSIGAHDLFSQLAKLEDKYDELGNKVNGIQNKIDELRDIGKNLAVAAENCRTAGIGPRSLRTQLS